jgi:hypothetical protein
MAGGCGFCLCLHPGLLRGISLNFSGAVMIADVVPLEKSRVQPAPTNQWPESFIGGRNEGSPIRGLGAF